MSGVSAAAVEDEEDGAVVAVVAPLTGRDGVIVFVRVVVVVGMDFCKSVHSFRSCNCMACCKDGTIPDPFPMDCTMAVTTRIAPPTT